MNRSQPLVGRSVAAVMVMLAAVLVGYVAVTEAKGTDPDPEATPRPDPVFVQSAVRLTTVAPDAGEMAVTVRGGIASGDRSRLFRGGPAASGGSRMVVFDPLTGDRVWSDRISDGLIARVASYDGSLVALGAPPTFDPNGYPVGRESTDVVIESATGDAARRYHLDGNIEPEAFSRDGSKLFVVQYVPATAPTGYRVRVLDLETRGLGPVDSPDIAPQQTMGGTARSQTLSPDGRRLYTLYSIPAGADGGPNHGVVEQARAFVHVLDLEEEWAHCVDLPAPFGEGDYPAGALAVSPDGDELFVADTASGAIARVDTVNLSPDEVAEPGLSVRPTAAAVSADGDLFLGGGGRLQVVDTSTMEVSGGWTTGGMVESVAVADDDDVYVATPGRIAIVDRDGDRRRLIELPDDGPITVGPGGFGVPGARQVLECAC